MNYNYSKLRGRIREYYGRESDFAKSMNLSNNSLSKKLNNKVRFTQDEITIMIERLDIKKVEIKDYFFTLEV